MTSPPESGTSPASSLVRRWLGALVLPAILLAWALLVVAPVWHQAARYCFTHYDLGIYTQALARLSLSDPNPWLSARQVHIFNDHFDPVLWLARPLREILPPVQAGLLAEALFVLLSVVPLLWLHARGLLDRASTALLCALLLLNSSAVDAVAFPIHPTTWAVLPWTLLAVAYCLRRQGAMLVALLLLFACKEEFPLVGLMLAAGLWLRGERRLALSVFAVSAAWLAFVFFVRPWWLGPTVDYRSRLLPLPGQDWWDYLRTRFAPWHLRRMGSMLVVFIPMAVWAWREKWKPDLAWLLMLLPMLGVRLAGMAWRDQYGAPLLAAAALAFLPLLLTRRPPAWVLASTALLLVTTNEVNFRDALRTLRTPESFPRHCPENAERLASIQRGLDLLASRPEGRALLGGNLVADLVTRDEVYAVGGPQPEGALVYDWVLVEKPPAGNILPVTHERMAQLIDLWRAEPGTEVLLDDAHVFLARGRFTTSH